MAEKVDSCCLSALDKHSHKEIVIPSNLHVHIGPSMSSFSLILTEGYDYIVF